MDAETFQLLKKTVRHGGAGCMAGYKVERFYRDVGPLRIYEGTSQIRQIIVARAPLREAGPSV